ncbi:hypothetical protein NDR87_09045 [Nocardia sp. CDC159]|uniref:Uncharacterized protein n=1 Tax=Nocardia pulmonis TaxID=2951408 RepID=A0A9X2E5T2_9NOCA|nr:MULTISPECIES: hypothetical protein [Nocardia]MCM6773613.1 hypothetical protein [Nocardia pulmonis]MCM6786500.1 hypothetical protein [Nocardia sp. CDC159]
MQMPVLLLIAGVILVATTALWRARCEDVPKVFASFASAFGRRAPGTPSIRRRAVPRKEKLR